MQLKEICCTATEPRPVEDLMEACDLHPQEEEMTLGLLKGLTEVISAPRYGMSPLFVPLRIVPMMPELASFLSFQTFVFYFPLR